MRDHTNHIVLKKEEAVAKALEAAGFVPRGERIPVASALGRVLVEDSVSQVTVPSAVSSRMDAVALRWSDIEAGVPEDTIDWKRGEKWDYANTGCALPPGYDTAQLIEQVNILHSVDGNDCRIQFKSLPKQKGANTIPVGSILMPGQLLASAGSVLTPSLQAAIVSGGNPDVAVAVKPKVGFIPTGNELVECSDEPPYGKTINSNSILLSGLIQQWGGEAVMHEIVPDDRKQIEAAILEMCDTCDIVVINAGSSKGSDDWTMEILESIGTVISHEVNHAPSKHSAYAVVNGTVVVGIAGPARGAAFTSEFYVKPLICQFLGLPVEAPTVMARLTEDIEVTVHTPRGGEPKSREGMDFFIVRHMLTRVADDGVLEVTPVNMGDVAGMNNSGAYFFIQRNENPVSPKKGEMVQVTLRWPYLL